MSKQEFNGKTLDEALATAARALGTDVTLLSYNILPQSSGGLFSKLFQRGVRLEAWVDNKNDVQAAAREAVRQAMSGGLDSDKPQPRERTSQDRGRQPKHEKQEHSKAVGPRSSQDTRGPRANGQAKQPNQNRRDSQPQPRRELRPQPRQNVGEEEQAERIIRPRLPLNSEESKGLLLELALQFAQGFDPDSTPMPKLEFLSDEEVIVTVNAPNLEELLVRSDRLSCAFEHLFKRIAQKRFADISGRVILNAGTAAQQREDKLRDTALDVAAKVKENGKTITLSSKSSQERRIIHLALENMDGIATKSVGIGENRKLVVYSTLRPARGHSDSNNREQRPRQSSDRPRTGSGQGQGNWTAQGGEGAEAGQPRRSRRRGRRGGSSRHGAQRGVSSPSQTQENQTQDHENGSPSLNSEV
jgi:spoIIIJ-associated protein